MSPSDLARVREILERAIDHPPQERFAIIESATGGDTEIRAEVLSLLAAFETGGQRLEPPPSVDRSLTRPTATTESLTGLAFGSYVVGERLGQGGMGVVYLGRDSRLARAVALKALPPELADEPSRRVRLEQEARHLAALIDRQTIALRVSRGTEIDELVARGLGNGHPGTKRKSANGKTHPYF